MVKCQTNEQSHKPIKDQHPRYLYVELLMKEACNGYQATFPDNHRDTIERRTDTNKERLIVLIKSHHIESISRNIMCRTTESQQPEETNASLKPQRGVYGKRYSRKSCTKKHLHDNNPPTFRLH